MESASRCRERSTFLILADERGAHPNAPTGDVSGAFSRHDWLANPLVSRVEGFYLPGWDGCHVKQSTSTFKPAKRPINPGGDKPQSKVPSSPQLRSPTPLAPQPRQLLTVSRCEIASSSMEPLSRQGRGPTIPLSETIENPAVTPPIKPRL